MAVEKTKPRPQRSEHKMLRVENDALVVSVDDLEHQALLDKLYVYRNKLKGDFEQKVIAMNKLTEKLLEQDD